MNLPAKVQLFLQTNDIFIKYLQQCKSKMVFPAACSVTFVSFANISCVKIWSFIAFLLPL